MKVFSMSQRIYYKDLEPEAESIIKKDLELYNCMLHKAFKICFDRAYKDVTYSETDQRMIKSFYGTSDYFPLSAINEAKALVKSLKCLEKENQDMIKTRLKKIDKKIKKKENKTLSSFAYKKILEKLERKCLMNEVDVIKVDPKNTSKIGKEKYTKIKGLSVHYCAAYVINRRGMGFVD